MLKELKRIIAEEPAAQEYPAYHLNLYEYLKYLLEHRPNSDMTDEELDSLAPWNETVQQQCSNKTE